MVQYCANSLFVAKLPGNKYFNGILFGTGETATMFFSQWLMNNVMDMTAFRIMYIIGLVSYLVVIFLPDAQTLIYIATATTVVSTGGWFNTIFLVMELRIPNANIGSVSALTRTMAVGSSIMAPTIANLPAPYPQVFLVTLSTFAFSLSYLLPPPGINMPTAQRKGDNSTVIIDKQSNAPAYLTGMDPNCVD